MKLKESARFDASKPRASRGPSPSKGEVHSCKFKRLCCWLMYQGKDGKRACLHDPADVGRVACEVWKSKFPTFHEYKKGEPDGTPELTGNFWRLSTVRSWENEGRLGCNANSGKPKPATYHEIPKELEKLVDAALVKFKLS